MWKEGRYQSQLLGYSEDSLNPSHMQPVTAEPFLEKGSQIIHGAHPTPFYLDRYFCFDFTWVWVWCHQLPFAKCPWFPKA